MVNYDFTHFPPSHDYNDIIKKIREGEVAYCYSGRDNRRGSFILIIDGSKMITKLDEDAGILAGYELWAFLHEIPNGEIRQEAINRWYDFYALYYKYLGLEDYEFELGE